jgi:hypothetical protein
MKRWLKHKAASFTLHTYAHLLDEGVGEAWISMASYFVQETKPAWRY